MTTRSPYRYGRPGTAAARLREAVHRALLEHEAAGELPTSNRFLYYELVQAGVVDKTRTRRTGRGSDQDLADACKWLRDEGLVPWDWIVDETREVTVWNYAPTIADYLTEVVDVARIDCWAGLAPPLLLCESRTFGGVLKRTLAPEYLCPVAATNGQVGGFLHTDIAPLLKRTDRPVLYVGDYDIRGLDIERNTQRVLDHTALTSDPEVLRAWMRIALTPDQVEAYGIPAVTKYDRVKRVTAEAYEVEALGQGTVTAIVRAALDELLPEPLERVQVREQRQREAEAEALRRRGDAL
jgi:hypothetical protein